MNAAPQRFWTLRRVVLSVAIVVLAGLGSALWIAASPGPMDFSPGPTAAAADSHAGASPTGVPPELAGASVVERGQYLARAADCEACHTAQGGARFAGGVAFRLPFGTLYSPNITPDPETGIGRWNDAEFLRAMHQGISRDGSRLYPVFPFTAYSYLTDADVLAIKAYLFNLTPVHAAPRSSSLGFPFNQRWLMSVWSALFNRHPVFSPVADRSAQWNRGAYLVEALEHCGECHTPRNLLQALDNRRKFSGAIVAGWRAPGISSDSRSGIGAWSEADLVQYLATDHADGHGSGAGPMGEVVDLSLRHLTDGDIRAIVVYVRSVAPIAGDEAPLPLPGRAPADHRQGVAADVEPRGKRIFEGACVGCHSWSGVSPVSAYATLTGARALADPEAINVIQVVLQGNAGRSALAPGFMPGFGEAYSDEEVAAVANYVIARFDARPSHITAAQVAALRRQSG